MAQTIKPILRVSSLSLVFALAVTLTGCSISTRHSDGRDNANGSSSDNNKDVDIRTPFGSLSVHQGSMEARDTGLSAYPGAQLKKSTDHEGDANANVNISSSMFGMKLVAIKYVTKDSPEKVVDFYRKELARYGKVVDCHGGFTMDFHPREKDNNEVTCNHENRGNGEYNQELKVGTESNQRVVAIKPVSDGTEFALVYVRSRNDKDTM